MARLTRRLTDHNSAGEAAVWKADKNIRQDPARSRLTLCWRTDQQIIPSFSMSSFFVSFATNFYLSPTVSAQTNQSQSAQSALATNKNTATTQHNTAQRKSCFWPCLAPVSTSSSTRLFLYALWQVLGPYKDGHIPAIKPINRAHVCIRHTRSGLPQCVQNVRFGKLFVRRGS